MCVRNLQIILVGHPLLPQQTINSDNSVKIVI